MKHDKIPKRIQAKVATICAHLDAGTLLFTDCRRVTRNPAYAVVNIGRDWRVLLYRCGDVVELDGVYTHEEYNNRIMQI